MNKVNLKGLTLADYLHPEEESFRLGADNIFLVRKALDILNDISVQLVRQITEGKWVELKPETAPDILKTVEEVCQTLDFPKRPKIFTRHERSTKIIVGGTDYMQMLIPDYVLNEYDADMKRYAFGNAISMFKAGHVQLANISSVLFSNSLTAPMQVALFTYLRAADLTSDRGGLLACQNFSAAARCILVEAGLSLTEMRYLNDEEILSLAEEYLQEISYGEVGMGDVLTETAAFWKRIDTDEAPPPVRLKELLNWYRDGYEKVLSKRSC